MIRFGGIWRPCHISMYKATSCWEIIWHVPSTLQSTPTHTWHWSIQGKIQRIPQEIKWSQEITPRTNRNATSPSRWQEISSNFWSRRCSSRQFWRTVWRENTINRKDFPGFQATNSYNILCSNTARWPNILNIEQRRNSRRTTTLASQSWGTFKGLRTPFSWSALTK